MTDRPSISFLVCTRNRAEILLECIEELLSSSRTDFEIIVRDNCSTDHTLDLLSNIKDERLHVYSAPQNQSTLTFYEISRLAKGNIVTWLSDEDSFQFNELDFVLDKFQKNPHCNVVFGGIKVGNGRFLSFPDSTITNIVKAHITALSFSGCGGLFVRRTSLMMANAFDVQTLEDAYALWNYYPVGFFASRCLSDVLVTTSRVVVRQTRFAKTTHNWSETNSTNYSSTNRHPHYYPDVMFERVVSNILNIFFKELPLVTKLRICYFELKNYIYYILRLPQSDIIPLLRENYPEAVVSAYNYNLNRLNLYTPLGCSFYLLKKMVFVLPYNLLQTGYDWYRLAGKKI